MNKGNGIAGDPLKKIRFFFFVENIEMYYLNPPLCRVFPGKFKSDN